MAHTIKQDQGKARLDLVEPSFIVTVAKVMTYGIEEQGYKQESWKKVPDPINRYYAAIQRHLLAWRDGEDYAPDSRFHHLAHVAANAMILLWFEIKKYGKEVRINGPKDL